MNKRVGLLLERLFNDCFEQNFTPKIFLSADSIRVVSGKSINHMRYCIPSCLAFLEYATNTLSSGLQSIASIHTKLHICFVHHRKLFASADYRLVKELSSSLHPWLLLSRSQKFVDALTYVSSFNVYWRPVSAVLPGD